MIYIYIYIYINIYIKACFRQRQRLLFRNANFIKNDVLGGFVLMEQANFV